MAKIHRPFYQLIWLLWLLSACAFNAPSEKPEPPATEVVIEAIPTDTIVPRNTATIIAVINTPIPTVESTGTTIDLTLTPAGDYGMGSDIIEITGTIGLLQEVPYEHVTHIAPFTPTGAGVAYVDINISETTEIIRADGTTGSVNDLVVGTYLKAIGTMGGSIGAHKIFILE